MQYLGEREIAFDMNSIGFPSIQGCRAIVLLTAGGLFGFHLSGNLTTGKNTAFAQFVSGHPQGGAQRALYVAGKVGFTHTTLDQAKAEIKEVATALGYTGPCYWVELSQIASSGIYVQFDSLQNTSCVITARGWDDSSDKVPGNLGAYVAVNRAMALGSAPAQMFINVSTAGLKAVYPAKVS